MRTASGRLGPWLGRFLFELVLVFLTVTSALIANDWWQGRTARRAAVEVLEMCREETQRNLRNLRAVMARQRELLQRTTAFLKKSHDARIESVEELRDVFTGGQGLAQPRLETTGWRTAQNTDALRHLPRTTVRWLSAIYDLVERVSSFANRFLERVFLDPDLLDPALAVRSGRMFAVYLSVLLELEQSLARAIEHSPLVAGEERK